MPGPARLLVTLTHAGLKAAKAKLRTLGAAAEYADWPARAAVCERCPLLVRQCDVSYCGKPFLRMPVRDEAVDGCGCPTHAKAKDPAEHCPITPRHLPRRARPGRLPVQMVCDRPGAGRSRDRTANPHRRLIGGRRVRSIRPMTALTGKFLLASRDLLDPNFARAAVLVVRHDEEGAFGLIVNRPMNLTVAAALGDAIQAAGSSDATVFSGGPCQGPVFVLHADPAIGGESPLDGVFVTTDREAIETLMLAQSSPLKVFGTYSGWSPQQLEGELAEGSWLVCDVRPGDVFSPDVELWSRLFSRTQLSKYIRPDQIPDDPSVN